MLCGPASGCVIQYRARWPLMVTAALGVLRAVSFPALGASVQGPSRDSVSASPRACLTPWAASTPHGWPGPLPTTADGSSSREMGT